MGNYRLSDALVRDPANANDDNERLLQLIEAALSGGGTSILGTLISFAADLRTGVNQYVSKTLTLNSTDYTTDIPDSARIITLYSTGTFRYALNEAVGSFNSQVDNSNTLAVGTLYSETNSVSAIILPAGVGRVLHMRSVNAATVVVINFR